MSSVTAIMDGLANWPQPIVEGSTVIVPTHCLYPSRTVVNAFVDGGHSSAVVSDGGGALGEARSLFGDQAKLFKVLRQHAREWGLSVGKQNGWLYSQAVSLDQISSMIAVVASASRDAARALVSISAPKPNADWVEDFARSLVFDFGSNVSRNVQLVGESTKTHRYDFVIRLPGRASLVIETVRPDPNSINSAIVHQLDLRKNKSPEIQQRIVYNEAESWAASSLALLEVGAPTVAYAEAINVIKRLAA